MQNSKKLIFFGTSEFAVPALKMLHQDKYAVSLVVTVPDKPIGRKQTLTPSPVKIAAQKLGCRVSTVLDIDELSECEADCGVVAAYGKIIPQKILDLFSLGILNIHPSLLPQYRGPSPIQTAILNGDKKTGVTIIKLDKQMDHGPIIKSLELEIGDLNALELSDKLALAGADLLIKILPDYLSEKIIFQPQNDCLASFTKILRRDDGKINWQNRARKIERMTKAYFPWPGVFGEFFINNPKSSKLRTVSAKLIKVLLSQERFNAKPGELTVKNNRLYAQCSDGALLIEKLHLQDKKEMTGQEFIRGYIK